MKKHAPQKCEVKSSSNNYSNFFDCMQLAAQVPLSAVLHRRFVLLLVVCRRDMLAHGGELSIASRRS